MDVYCLISHAGQWRDEHLRLPSIRPHRLKRWSVALCVQRVLDIDSGHHIGQYNQETVLSQVPADADTSTKSKVAYWIWLAIATLVFGQVSLGPELEGLRVDRLVVMHRPHVLVHNGALGDESAVVNIVVDGSVGDAEWGQWVHPVSLLQDEVEVGEMGYVVKAGQAVLADDKIKLFLCFDLNRGVLHEVEDKENNGGGRLSRYELKGTEEAERGH